MRYLVSTLSDIELMPSTEIVEIIQAVKTIISTIKGSVPLDRDFGIDSDFIDNPTPMAQMQLRVSIIDAISKYEPRAIVKSIEYKQDSNALEGILKPIVTIEIESTDES